LSKKYQLAVLAIQETKFKEEGILDLQTTDGKKRYELYHTGSEEDKHHGVGIIIEKGIEAQFKTITNRICMATIKLEGKDNQRKLIFISTYAPTLEVSEKNPKIREDYYEDLENTISQISERDICIIGGDQNAKTGLGHQEFPEVIGRYGKGEMNSSGRILAEMLMKNEMILCNTLFPHKMAHRTTWEAPERKQEHKDKNGEIRRNPYRNQIDYIMTRKKHRRFIEDARSYSGIETYTDHRLVKAKLNIEWYKMKPPKNKSKLKIEKLRQAEEQ
jgi:exonuclease III